MNMRILANLPEGFFQYPALKDSFQRLRNRGELRLTSHNLTEEILPDLRWADAVIMWSWPELTEDLLASATRLKFVGHLDVTQRAARTELAHGLAVSVSRGGFSPAVAEMSLALILNCLRRVSHYHGQMRSGEERWVDRFPDDIDPSERELTGARVGVIGFGGVGKRLASLLKPFDCELRGYDPYVSEEKMGEYAVSKTSLHSLLANSEIVILCAASNSGTKRLIGEEEIELLSAGSLFVNVARAALVDTDALIRRLERGDMTVALDVFDMEPLDRQSRLRSLPNAYLTPHRAGGICASVVRIVNWLVDDFEAYLDGMPRSHTLEDWMLNGLDL
jgi:D-3-phosphoglycerate dehydrogenase